LNNVEGPNQVFIERPMSTQNEYQYSDLGGALECELVLVAMLLVPVDCVIGIMAFIREGDNRVRQRALSDNLVLGLVLAITFGSIRDVIIEAVVVPLVHLDHIVTVALGINGLATGNVMMMLAAGVKPSTGGEKVVSAPGLEHTALEYQTSVRTLLESPTPSEIVLRVGFVALFGNTLILAWGRSRSGQGSQGGQDGE